MSHLPLWTRCPVSKILINPKPNGVKNNPSASASQWRRLGWAPTLTIQHIVPLIRHVTYVYYYIKNITCL